MINEEEIITGTYTVGICNCCIGDFSVAADDIKDMVDQKSIKDAIEITQNELSNKENG